MSFTTPRTWTSEVLTSPLLNEQLRDNLLHIAGATGKGSDPSRTPCVRAYKSGTQSIATGITTALTFDSESYDTDTMHSTSVDTNRITIATAGKYRITAQVRFDSNGTGSRQCRLRLNGTDLIGITTLPPASGSAHDQQVVTEHDLAADDYVETLCLQSSGGSLDVLGGIGVTWMTAARIG